MAYKESSAGCRLTNLYGIKTYKQKAAFHGNNWKCKFKQMFVNEFGFRGLGVYLL